MNDEAFKFFQQYDEPFRSLLIFLSEFPHFNILSIIKIVLSCLAFIFNLIHLLVLCQKQMRSASVNVLMIGLALSDLIYFTIEAIDVVMNFYPFNECTPPYSYAGTVIIFVKTNFYNIFRRLSPWIGVIMAFTRLLVSSYPFNVTIGKMGNPKFAVWSLLMSSVMSTFMESDLYALREIATIYTWHPGTSCGFPTNFTQPIYQVQFYGWMNDFTNLANRFDNAKVAVKFLPAVILPFLTIGLVKVLKNIRISKERLHTNLNDTTYQTTRLVTIMTICLVTTEVSTGIYSLLSTILRTTLSTATISAFSLIVSILNDFFFLLYPLNSMAHCFITWFLSSHYRSCAKSLFPFLKLFETKAKKESAPMSFQSTNNRLNGVLASVET